MISRFYNDININTFVFIVQLPDHDLTLEAAWPELFVDRNGKYWDMPESISLDCASLISESGLRYHFGIHRNGGAAKAALDSGEDPVPIPASLNPGICAKAAFSYEKSKDLWRELETKEDLKLVKRREGSFRNSAYDLRMKEPHAAISGIFGKSLHPWAPFVTHDMTEQVVLVLFFRLMFNCFCVCWFFFFCFNYEILLFTYLPFKW